MLLFLPFLNLVLLLVLYLCQNCSVEVLLLLLLESLWLFLSGDHPHLVQLLFLDLAIFIQKVQKVVALFNDLCVEGCSKEDAEDLLLQHPSYHTRPHLTKEDCNGFIPKWTI